MLMHNDSTYITDEFYQYYLFYSSIFVTFSEGWIQLLNDVYTSGDFTSITNVDLDILLCEVAEDLEGRCNYV